MLRVRFTTSDSQPATAVHGGYPGRNLTLAARGGWNRRAPFWGIRRAA